MAKQKRNIIDIHCHIMPGVDDGSPDTQTSLKMLQIADQDGIKACILTPHHKPMHHNVSREHAPIYTKRLQQEATNADIDVKLFTGSEIYYSDETAQAIEDGRIITMAGSDYVLIEFHPTDLYRNIHNAMYRVLGSGYRPIIAHVERYEDVAKHIDRVEELIDMGCLIQVNAASVMGDLGFGLKHFTRKLISKGMVHFIASDAHDAKRRTPQLGACRDLVAKKYGERTADTIFFNNPIHILKNEDI